jgi:hypothetical protein
MDGKEKKYRELQERYRLPGSPIKGISRINGYDGDLYFEQATVAQIIVDFLGVTDSQIIPEPRPNKMPDVLINSNDTSIGLEVTELVDEKIRSEHFKRRKAEQDLGIMPLEAFQLYYKGCHPLFQPGQDRYIPPHAARRWTEDYLFCKLKNIIFIKNEKLSHHIGDANFPDYHHLILAIYTGESIDQDLVTKTLNRAAFDSGRFDKVYLILNYQSESPNYPVIQLA